MMRVTHDRSSMPRVVVAVCAALVFSGIAPVRGQSPDAPSGRPYLRLVIRGAPSADSARAFDVLGRAAAKAWNVEVIGLPDLEKERKAQQSPESARSSGPGAVLLMEVRYERARTVERLVVRVIDVMSAGVRYRGVAPITGADRQIEFKDLPPLSESTPPPGGP
jgi:hypothetical protein